jgi:hypothetical protein
MLVQRLSQQCTKVSAESAQPSNALDNNVHTSNIEDGEHGLPIVKKDSETSSTAISTHSLGDKKGGGGGHGGGGHGSGGARGGPENEVDSMVRVRGSQFWHSMLLR